MKFTLSWLKQPLETNATLDEIVEQLTMLGLEVEGVEDPAKKLEPSASPKFLKRHLILTPTNCGSAK